MYDLQKQIERIVALDKARTQGDWTKNRKGIFGYMWSLFGGNTMYKRSTRIFNTPIENKNGDNDFDFILAAPEMVRIILALQQQIKEREGVPPKVWSNTSTIGGKAYNVQFYSGAVGIPNEIELQKQPAFHPRTGWTIMSDGSWAHLFKHNGRVWVDGEEYVKAAALPKEGD